MLKDVILGVQKIFELSNSTVKLDPLLVCGLRYAMIGDASIDKPNPHRIDRSIRRFEEINNFVGSIVLPIIGRSVMRARAKR
jgi:hypothetical protein